jgi:hypothetical protein
LVRRQYADRVGAVRRTAQGADDLHPDGHHEIALEVGDERPQREHRRLARRADGPHLLGPEPVDELAHRQGGQERCDAGARQTETHLSGGQPDDLREEHRGAGHERALAEREQQ